MKKSQPNYFMLLIFALLLGFLSGCNTVLNPSPNKAPETLKGVGLLAEYFSFSDFTGSRSRQIDSRINFDWGQASPSNGVLPETFSARWTGEITVNKTGAYRFFPEAFGWYELKISGRKVSPGETLYLDAENSYTIELSFKKTSSEASLKLKWQRPGNDFQEIIGHENFTPTQMEVSLQPLNTDLINNGDFEAGTGNWTGSASISSPGQNSNNALRAENYAWVQQDIAYSFLSPGQYSLTAYARTIGSGSCTVGIGGGGGTNFDRNMQFESASWTKQELSLSLQTDTNWAAVYLKTDLSACEFDMVSLIKLSDTPQAEDGNVINNGNFATNLSSWNQYGGQVNLETGFTGQGLSVSNWAWVQQNLSLQLLQTGRSYRFSLYGKSNDGQACTAGLVAATATATAFDQKLTFSSSSFQSKELSVDIETELSWVAVYLTGSNCSFDEVSLLDLDQTPSLNLPDNSPNVSVTALSRTDVQICWDKAIGAISYRIERQEEGQSFVALVAGLPGPCYDDLGLPDGMNYSYKIISANAQGQSSGVTVSIKRAVEGPADAILLDDIVEYDWLVGCVPTAVSMLMGYWDRNGYPNLISGDSSYYSSDVINAIASDGHMQDYAFPNGSGSESFDDAQGLVKDASETKLLGQRHQDDSIADFLFSSRSRFGSDFGMTFWNWVPAGIHGYANARGYHGFQTTQKTWGSFGFNDLVTEIDKGKPLIFAVDPDGLGPNASHAVLVVGYSRSTNQYAFLAGWSATTKLRWASFEKAEQGNNWGIQYAYFVTPQAQTEMTFVGLDDDQTGTASSYQSVLGTSFSTTKLQNDSYLGWRTIGLATADGHTYYSLFNDLNGTAQLIKAYAYGDGRFRWEDEVIAETTLSRTNTLGFTTADGKTFYQLLNDGSGSAALYRLTINVDGSFSSQLLNADSGASLATLGLATKDGKTFYQLYNDGVGTAALYSASLQSNGSFNFQLLSSDSGYPLTTIDFDTW